MATISIIQSAKNNGIVDAGVSSSSSSSAPRIVTATFDNPVTAGNSVIAVITLENGVHQFYSDSVLSLGSDGYLIDGGPSIWTGELAAGSPVGGPLYNGPVAIVYLCNDGALPIAGLQTMFAAPTFLSYGEVKIAIYEVAGLNTVANWQGYYDVTESSDAVSGTTVSVPAINCFHLNPPFGNAPPSLFIAAVYDNTNTDDTFTSSEGYAFTDTLNSEVGSLGIVLKLFTGDPGTYDAGIVTSSNSSTSIVMCAAAVDPAYVMPPPPPPPPLRLKRLPLTVDFASCSYDQASRLLMYELYRSLGLDPSHPFLQGLFPGLAGTPWRPPYTVVLRAWGEAVDAVWNILKGEPDKPLCGRVITIDASVSPEWAGDYELMELRMFPFQGDASLMSSGRGGAGRASATAVQPASADSGTLELTLRTYNPDVFFDVSADPTYATVPGADLATGSW